MILVIVVDLLGGGDAVQAAYSVLDAECILIRTTNSFSHMLYDNNEAADTIAHELWHAYQHERAMNPQSAKDYQYQYGFENYIRPDDDFTAYQDQLVEAEARAFAQQFKDRLSTKRRNI